MASTNTDTRTLVLSAIKRLMNPADFHKATDDAELSDLIPHLFDLKYTLATDLEHALDYEFPEAELAGWHQVADVLATVAKVRADRLRGLDGLIAMDGDLV